MHSDKKTDTFLIARIYAENNVASKCLPIFSFRSRKDEFLLVFLYFVLLLLFISLLQIICLQICFKLLLISRVDCTDQKVDL